MKTLLKHNCTDPDSLQFGQKIDDRTWHYKEFNRFEYPSAFKVAKELYFLHQSEFDVVWAESKYWITEEINLKYYSEQQMWQACEGYYQRTEFDKMLNNGEYQIIIECIFEQNSGQY